MTIQSAPSMDEWDGHLAAGHAEYRGWCPFCVAKVLSIAGSFEFVNDVIMSRVETLVIKSVQEASILEWVRAI